MESGDMVKIKGDYTGIPSSEIQKYHLRVQLHNVDDLQKMECDDRRGHNVNTNGDFWRVFVR